MPKLTRIIDPNDAPLPSNAPKRIVISEGAALWARANDIGYLIESAFAIQMVWRQIPKRAKREIVDDIQRRNALTLATRRNIHERIA